MRWVDFRYPYRRRHFLRLRLCEQLDWQQLLIDARFVAR